LASKHNFSPSCQMCNPPPPPQTLGHRTSPFSPPPPSMLSQVFFFPLSFFKGHVPLHTLPDNIPGPETPLPLLFMGTPLKRGSPVKTQSLPPPRHISVFWAEWSFPPRSASTYNSSPPSPGTRASLSLNSPFSYTLPSPSIEETPFLTLQYVPLFLYADDAPPNLSFPPLPFFFYLFFERDVPYLRHSMGLSPLGPPQLWFPILVPVFFFFFTWSFADFSEDSSSEWSSTPTHLFSPKLGLKTPPLPPDRARELRDPYYSKLRFALFFCLHKNLPDPLFFSKSPTHL